MKEKMTLTEAVHLMREEAVRCRRMADDLAENPLDMDGKCLEWAKGYRQKAEALETLLNAVREG